jgi:hypothetical protein
VARYKGRVSRIYFRGDAGFANPEIYDYLEGEGIKYAIRLPANRVLQERIGDPKSIDVSSGITAKNMVSNYEISF